MTDLKWIKKCDVCGEELRLVHTCYRCPNCGWSTCSAGYSQAVHTVLTAAFTVLMLMLCFYCVMDEQAFMPTQHKVPTDKQAAVIAQTRVMQEQVSSINAFYERRAKP